MIPKPRWATEEREVAFSNAGFSLIGQFGQRDKSSRTGGTTQRRDFRGIPSQDIIAGRANNFFQGVK